MYTPSENILKKYADVLVKFALWGGSGVKKGENICLMIPESAKLMLDPLIISTLERGANPIVHYLPESFDRWEGVNRAFYENASIEQLKNMPKNYLLNRIKDSDHYLMMISHDDPKGLDGVDPKKIMARQEAIGFYKKARDEKENRNQFSWTMGLFGTEAMASEANMQLEEYWEQIITACYLQEDDPIARWKDTYKMITEIKNKLSALKIEYVHVTGKNIDLDVKVGKDRQWLGGGGRNIPSYEIFVSPDWRGTNGTIKFNQPLYLFGNLVSDIELKFKDGIVVESTATQGAELLKDMIAVENANKIGEFSLTDSRHSQITKFMAETLYDENVGGKFGNTHIALGSTYKDSFTGNIPDSTAQDWKERGFNESAIHTDIMSTEDRTVEATLSNGRKVIIYENGQFTV